MCWDLNHVALSCDHNQTAMISSSHRFIRPLTSNSLVALIISHLIFKKHIRPEVNSNGISGLSSVLGFRKDLSMQFIETEDTFRIDVRN